MTRAVLLVRMPGDPEDPRYREVAGTAVPLALVVPASTIESLDPGLLADLRSAPLDWVRTGWSEPWFPMLPVGEIRRQLLREEEALVTAGLRPGPLWVTGPWEPHLAGAFAAAGVTTLLLASDRLSHPGPGVVSHVDTVLPVYPVGDPPGLVVETLPPDVEPVSFDDLARQNPPVAPQRPRADDWQGLLLSAPRLVVLHRKLVRLVSGIPERVDPETESALLAAEAGRWYRGEPRPVPAHTALIEARHRIETRRGDDWGTATRLDWDGDGAEEVHVELPRLSFVIAPHRSGAVPTLDLKQPTWPVTGSEIDPGWILCHAMNDGIVEVSLAVSAVEERRGGSVSVGLVGSLGPGRVSCSLAASGSTLRLRYQLTDAEAVLLGPQLKLAMGASTTLRVDGGPPTALDPPVAVSGHRFRLTDEDRHVVFSSSTPLRCFAQAEVVDAEGLVVWPHWPAADAVSFELAIDLDAPGLPG